MNIKQYEHAEVTALYCFITTARIINAFLNAGI